MPERYAFDEYDSQRDTLPPAQLDLRRITYQLIWDEDWWMTKGSSSVTVSGVRSCGPSTRISIVVQDDERRECKKRRTRNSPWFRGGGGNWVAPEIKYIDFRYFDGAIGEIAGSTRQRSRG